MNGIVSLISDFSVSCVLEDGRISLAHLMEFSNFVDLYVLENDVYVDASAKDVTYLAFGDDKTCPLHKLEDNKLTNAVFAVSDSTRALYDWAPSRAFDINSYDYWLKLSKNDKDKVPNVLSHSEEFKERNGLLVSSKRLEGYIRLTLEELSKSSLTLMPSSRNLLPFLDVFHQIDTPALLMYRELASQHREMVEKKILPFIRPRKVYLPPLLTVLLSRCEKPTDIPRRLIELRGELQDFREGVNNWLTEFDKATSLKEKIEVRDEFDDAISTMSKRFRETRTTIIKELIGSALEGVEDGDYKKIITKPAFRLLEEGITNIIPDKLMTRRFTGLVDLMDQALKVKDNMQILEKVFGEKLDISQQEITNVKQYRKNLASKFNLDVPMPT
jgi:predicted DNA-binding protein